MSEEKTASDGHDETERLRRHAIVSKLFTKILDELPQDTLSEAVLLSFCAWLIAKIGSVHVSTEPEIREYLEMQLRVIGALMGVNVVTMAPEQVAEAVRAATGSESSTSFTPEEKALLRVAAHQTKGMVH